MGFYDQARVAVTGGLGFLARHVAEALSREGARVVLVDRRAPASDESLPAGAEFRAADLQLRAEARDAFRDVDFVFHLAAVGWGFHENLHRQPELLTENLLLNTAVLDAAWRAGVKGFLLTSSSAVYPGDDVFLQEDTTFERPPHPGEALFGWSKRVAELQARAYFEHHQMPVAIVRPTNPYGPWDTFDPKRSHVIPALIRRALEGETPFMVWGTGQAVRSFIYAEDAARGMLLALERAGNAQPINLASPATSSIRDVVALVLEACGRGGEAPTYDLTKPDGPPQKVADVQRLQSLGLTEFTDLKEGIARTVAWYSAQRQTQGIS